jgi:hypothetical protein
MVISQDRIALRIMEVHRADLDEDLELIPNEDITGDGNVADCLKFISSLLSVGVQHLSLVRNFKSMMISIFVDVKSLKSIQRVVKRDIIGNLSVTIDRE